MLAYPDVINVRPGTLDDPSVTPPVAQLWAKLAHPWAIAPRVRCFDEDPADIEGLIAEWRELFG